MTQISEETMIRFIDNTCTDEELGAVERWLAESPDHAAQLFELERTAMLAGTLRGNAACRNRVYRKVRERIEEQQASRRRRMRMRIMRWSAAAAVLVGVAFLVGFLMGRPQVEILTVTADSGSLEVTLPDSTQVWLNRGATLRYPAMFAASARRVELEGEAYFSVTKEPERPFEVKGERVGVRVLGTEFNFCSSRTGLSSVSLIEGSVEVTHGNAHDGIVLAPGQKAVFDPATGRMQVTETNTVLDAVWRDGIIPFTNAPISEIAVTLEQMYDVHITILGDAEGGSTYSGGILRYECIDSTLMMLCHTLPITYSVKGAEVTIALK